MASSLHLVPQSAAAGGEWKRQRGEVGFRLDVSALAHVQASASWGVMDKLLMELKKKNRILFNFVFHSCWLPDTQSAQLQFFFQVNGVWKKKK